MKDRSAALSRTALAGLMVGFFAAPAHAGFDWTPPPAAPVVSSSASEGPLVPAAPAPAVDATELMPVPGAEPAPQAVMEPVDSLPPATISQAPAIEKESTALPESKVPEVLDAPAQAGPFAQAMGFGSDIPLALALGQIVPAEFAYSFASNVNPGLKISWNGGKPWNEVLNEALKPHDMRADVVGTAVIVRSGVSAEAPRPVTNPMAYSTDPKSPSDAPQALNETAPAEATVRGEGTADNYPRRTPRQTGFLGSIFTPDDQKGNTAPRPPEMEKQGILIENEVPAESMTNNAEPVAKQAAAFEPAAPASTAAMPKSPRDPVSLSSQKISYADESLADNSSILPDRGSQQTETIEVKGKILDPFSVKFWQADSNQSLREVLTGWAEQAGVEVIWDSGYDYKLPKAMSLHGTFPEAVTKVFEQYGVTEPRPQGRLHPNLPKGPSVLLVENYP